MPRNRMNGAVLATTATGLYELALVAGGVARERTRYAIDYAIVELD